MSIKLRNYQSNALNTIINKLKKEKVSKQVIVLATGLGKTILFGHLPPLFKKVNKKTLILAHREELLDQAKDKLLLIDDSLNIQIEQGDRGVEDNNFDVLIASVQTLGRENSSRIKKFNPDEFGLIIIDECFVAGTKIDGKNIEDIQIGDYVNSYNEKTKLIEKKKVIRLFKNKVKQELIEVLLTNGKKLYCTPNHPFFVNNSWVSCRNLKTNDVLTDIKSFVRVTKNSNDSNYVEEIYKTKKLCGVWEGISTKFLELKNDSYLFQRVQKNKESRKKKRSSFTLLKLWERCIVLWKDLRMGKEGKSLLFRGVQENSASKNIFGNNVKNKQEICFKEDENKQPDEKPKKCCKNGIKNERKNFFREGWKRLYDKTTVKTLEGIRFIRRLFGVSDKNKRSKTFISVFAKLLFSRYWNTRNKISNRNRWKNTQTKKMEVFRQKKDGSFKGVRVASIKVLERGSGRKFRRVCKDGYVYNFEVEGNNNYFADGILVHNCHHATSSTYVNILKYFECYKGDEKYNKNNKLLLGVTATPTRSDKVGLNTIFDELVYSYDIRKGIENGYLSNIKAYSVKSTADLSKISSSGGDFTISELSEVIDTEERNKLIVSSYLELAKDTRAIAFTASIQHAQDLTECFNSVGVPSAYIIGDTNTEDRQEIFEKFKSGEIKVLCNVSVLTEGLDIPEIETVLMARPTKSSILYPQMLGRGLRLSPDKEHLILIDFVDNTGKNNIMTLPSLFGIPKNLKGMGKKGKYVLEFVEKAEKILDERPDYDLNNVDDWSDEGVEKVIKEVSLFAQAELPDEVKNGSEFAWEKFHGGYKISFPNKDDDNIIKTKEELIISLNMLNHFDIHDIEYVETKPSFKNGYKKWAENKIDNIGEFKLIDEALKYADKWISENKTEHTYLLRQDSKWRSDTPTDKQVALLKKLGVLIPKGISKGQASVLISKNLQKKKKVY